MYVCLLFGTTTVAMSIGENAQGAIPIRPYFLSVGLRLSDPITNLTQRADLTQRRRDSQRAAERSFSLRFSAFFASLRQVWFGIRCGSARRRRRFNAEARRLAESRREFFFSAFLRVPLRLCVKTCLALVRRHGIGHTGVGEDEAQGQREGANVER